MINSTRNNDCKPDSNDIQKCCAQIQRIFLPQLFKLRHYENTTDSLKLVFTHDQNLEQDLRAMISALTQCCSCLTLHLSTTDSVIELSIRHNDGDIALQDLLKTLPNQCCRDETLEDEACCSA